VQLTRIHCVHVISISAEEAVQMVAEGIQQALTHGIEDLQQPLELVNGLSGKVGHLGI